MGFCPNRTTSYNRICRIFRTLIRSGIFTIKWSELVPRYQGQNSRNRGLSLGCGIFTRTLAVFPEFFLCPGSKDQATEQAQCTWSRGIVWLSSMGLWHYFETTARTSLRCHLRIASHEIVHSDDLYQGLLHWSL